MRLRLNGGERPSPSTVRNTDDTETPQTQACTSPSPGSDPHPEAEEGTAPLPALDLLKNGSSTALMEVLIMESEVLDMDDAMSPPTSAEVERPPTGTGTLACPLPSPVSNPHPEAEEGTTLPPALCTLNGPTAAVMTVLPTATGVPADANTLVLSTPALNLPTREEGVMYAVLSRLTRSQRPHGGSPSSSPCSSVRPVTVPYQ